MQGSRKRSVPMRGAGSPPNFRQPLVLASASGAAAGGGAPRFPGFGPCQDTTAITLFRPNTKALLTELSKIITNVQKAAPFSL